MSQNLNIQGHKFKGMKNILLSIVLILAILPGYTQDKTGSISKENSYIDIAFNASDTINESETYWVKVSSPQNYSSMQDVFVSIDSASGAPNVYIALYGRLTSSNSWTAIGDSVRWYGTTADTSFIMSFTAPNRYREYKLSFRSSATNQQSLVTDVQFKQWFSGGAVAGASISDGTATLTGGALSGVTTLTLANGLTIDNAANNVLEFNENSDELKFTFGSNAIAVSSTDVTSFDFGTIDLGTDALDLSEGNLTNGGVASFDQVQADASALVIGAGTETVSINSSDWDIGTTGDITGIGNVTSNDKILTTDTIQGAVIQATGMLKGGLKMPVSIINTDGGETLDVTMSGSMCIATKSDGATTITIPDADTTIVGVVYYILQTADQNLIVTATTADNNDFVCDGVATSDNITISTASHQIGAGMIIIGMKIATGTFRWFVGGLNPESLLTPEAAD